MGTRIVETRYDDLDESTEDVKTVSLSLDGRAVEIDLSAKNLEKLTTALTPYLDAGRKASSAATSRRRRASASGAPPSGASSSGTSSSGTSSRAAGTQAIRDWAQANGLEVNNRGRIKKSVVEAYESATK